MHWEGKEALEQREASDRYFGMPIEEAQYDPTFRDPSLEDVGFEDGLDGVHRAGHGLKYELGWERGTALRRLRDEGKS